MMKVKTGYKLKKGITFKKKGVDRTTNMSRLVKASSRKG